MAAAASRLAVTPEVNASGVTPRLFAMRGSDVLRMAPSQYHEKRRSHNQRDALGRRRRWRWWRRRGWRGKGGGGGRCARDARDARDARSGCGARCGRAGGWGRSGGLAVHRVGHQYGFLTPRPASISTSRASMACASASPVSWSQPCACSVPCTSRWA